MGLFLPKLSMRSDFRLWCLIFHSILDISKIPHTLIRVHLSMTKMHQSAEGEGASAADSLVLSLRPQKQKAILNTKKRKLYSNNSIY